MTFSKLDQLYRQVVLDHAQHPRNYGIEPQNEPQNQATSIELLNPTCGDVIELQLEMDENGKIVQVRFAGQGCTISQASASMMTEVVRGKSRQEALQLCETFSALVRGEQVADADLGDAALLAGVTKFPARIKCATLAWKALEQLLEQEQ